MKLEHIAITISDQNEIEKFYRGVLGMEINKEFELNKDLSEKIFNIPSAVNICIVKKDNLAFEIFLSPETNNQKYNHICLMLNNREDACKKAIAAGYNYVRIERSNNDMIFLIDKSGNIFEIKEDN